MAAAGDDRIGVVQYLLDHGADIGFRNPSRETALHVASWYGYADVVRLLLERGADTTAVDVAGRTPLMFAAYGGLGGVVRMLLEHGGSDVDAAAHEDGGTAMHSACNNASSGAVRQLLDAGGDPTLRTTDGRTALDFAITHQHHDCVRLLQEWERAYTTGPAAYGMLHRHQHPLECPRGPTGPACSTPRV